MTKYVKTNITAKKGINFIRTIVEDSGCLFHKIEQENDLGIDCLIEFINDEKPAHKSLAVQVKSGQSYYNKASNECLIPVDSHYEYWVNYPLAVCGIVYIPELDKGFWINIKTYLKNNPDAKTIKFLANRSNQFDLQNFNRLFKPNVLGKTPNLPLEEALLFFDSKHQDEFILGALILFRRYINEPITWEKFIEHVIKAEPEDINFNILHYISHIPWHPDIFFSGEMVNSENKEYVVSMLNGFDKEIVIKLLNLIGEDGIQRGTIGQTIEAILSVIESISSYLEEIIKDKLLDIEIRHNAAVIYAYYNKKNSLDLLRQIDVNESWFIPEMVKYIEEFEWFNPYQ